MYKAAKNKIKAQVEWYYLIPIAFILSFLPMIVQMRVIELPDYVATVWGSDKNIDFFAYYKQYFLIIFTCFASLILLWKIITKKIVIKKTTLYIPIIIHTIFIILSTIFSEYKFIALLGFPDRYEGMWALLCYTLILFAAINFVDNEKHVKFLLKSLLVSATLLGILGFTQYFGFDFLQTSFGKSLILPAQYTKFAPHINFRFGLYTIPSTMYNINYVGSYTAMLFPISLILFTMSKNNKHRLLYGAFSCLMFFNWIGCNSRAGWVGGSFAILFILIFLYKPIIKNYRSSLILLTAFLLIFFSMNVASGGRVVKRVGTFSPATEIHKGDQLRDIKVDNDKLSLLSEKTELNVISSDELIEFRDESNKKIAYTKESKKDGDKEYIIINFENQLYSDYVLKFTKDFSFVNIAKDNINVHFAIKDNTFKYIDKKGQLVDLQPIEKWGFEGRESFASYRGYIWSRSIPLLKKSSIIGYGPDTYSLYFPHHDYIGHLFTVGQNTTVDKPHNMYLQYGINVGVVALLSIIALFAIYSFSSIKLYFGMKDFNLYSISGIACFTAFIGYGVAGIFNDSVVSVAPVFWIILGVGISMNYINSKKVALKSNK